MVKRMLLLSIPLLILACGNNDESKKDKITSIPINQESNNKNVQNNIGDDKKAVPTILSGDFDVEKLKGDLDLKMDISGLTLSEIRILRNSFAAKQGYCFMKADLRAIFNTTTWYDEKMEGRYWKEEEGNAIEPIAFTKEEGKFINKLKERENQLKLENFIEKGNQKFANTNNIINLFQMEQTPSELIKMLGKNGFAIIPNDNIQLFHVYEKNDYHQFPNFVTTDMYMQLFHMYFGYVLRTVEEAQFIPLLSQICTEMIKDMKSISDSNSDVSIKKIAEYNATYYAIALTVLTNEEIEVPRDYEKYYKKELKAINNEVDDNSEFLEFTNVLFPYSLFKPRGHYTRNESLKRYFRAMMWLQTAPFCLNKDQQLRRAILNASVLGNSPNYGEDILKKYKAISEPIDFIIGQPDNVSFLDLVQVIKEQDFVLDDLLTKDDSLEAYREIIKKIANTKNKIGSKQSRDCGNKINFIPQRYLFDNEILQELVDLKNKVTKRGYPKGLDVMAAIGSKSAENILLNELKEGENWEEYPQLLSSMQDKMKDLNWNETLYNKWMQSLLELQRRTVDYPYFMQSSQWDKKNLNASLASWAELKHDAILYAEQPMASECGDGGPPSPYTVGYVEPNIGYWTTVIELIDLAKEVLQRNNLITPSISGITTSLKENAEFLLSSSEKELKGIKLSNKEYAQIELIGSTFEWLTLDLVKEKDQYLSGWHDVKGPDKSVAVVADIYTANGENNPDKGILHVATGNVNDIYVVVEIEGYLYLTKGAVFGYHEFHLPMGNRLTDEEWQEMLEKNQAPDVPDWIKEIILPIDVPKTNEKIFYSSGC